MAWKQLITPQLPGTGQVGFCLRYARERYGIGAKYLVAWNAWSGAQFKHADRNFPPVSVPLWFKYPLPNSSPGHVVIRTPDGKLYSSPYKSTQSYYVFPSIEAVESTLGAGYVGWSEDINGVRVAINEGGDMPFIEQKVLDDLNKWKSVGQQLSYTKVYKAMGGSPGNPDANANQVQPIIQDLEKYADFVKGDPDWQGNLDDLDVVKKGSGGVPTVLVNGKEYIPKGE